MRAGLVVVRATRPAGPFAFEVNLLAPRQAGNAAPSAAPEPKAKAEPKAKRGPGRPRKSGPAPQEASAAPASTGKRKAEDLFFTEEPVNRASIEAFMKLRGSRKVILESGYSLFETLGFFLVRAADGYMKVTWRESKIPGDILGRRFSGVDNGMEPPRDSDFFDVPHSHACTSAFAHPRLIKEICRRGLKGWVDVDVVNSVFSQFAANFQECPDVVKRYNRDRDGMIAGVREAYGCSRDVAKRLFIRLGFMGRVESWLEDFGLKKNEGPLEAELVCFGQDMRRFGEALVAKDAGYFELFKDKKYPLGSFMSAIYFKLERRFLDRMIAAVPEPAEVLSFEHDGLGIKLNGLSETALLEALNFNPMVKVVIKTPHDPLELAREQFPGEEWVGPTAVSGLQFDAAELHRALLVTRRCMQPMKPQKEGEPWSRRAPRTTPSTSARSWPRTWRATSWCRRATTSSCSTCRTIAWLRSAIQPHLRARALLLGGRRAAETPAGQQAAAACGGQLPAWQAELPEHSGPRELDLPAMPRAQAGRPAAHQPPGSLRGWLGLRLPRRQLLPCQAQRFLQAQPALEALPPRLVGERGGPQSREGVDGAAQEEPQGLDRGGLASDRGDAGHAEEGRQAGAGALGQALRLRPLLEVAECLQRGRGIQPSAS